VLGPRTMTTSHSRSTDQGSCSSTLPSTACLPLALLLYTVSTMPRLCNHLTWHYFRLQFPAKERQHLRDLTRCDLGSLAYAQQHANCSFNQQILPKTPKVSTRSWCATDTMEEVREYIILVADGSMLVFS
jgi:hypothetical protein